MLQLHLQLQKPCHSTTTSLERKLQWPTTNKGQAVSFEKRSAIKGTGCPFLPFLQHRMTSTGSQRWLNKLPFQAKSLKLRRFDWWCRTFLATISHAWKMQLKPAGPCDLPQEEDFKILLFTFFSQQDITSGKVYHHITPIYPTSFLKMLGCHVNLLNPGQTHVLGHHFQRDHRLIAYYY